MHFGVPLFSETPIYRYYVSVFQWSLGAFRSTLPMPKLWEALSICWEHHVIWFILRSSRGPQLKSHVVLLDWSCTLQPSCINFRKVQRGNWWPRSMEQTSWGLMLPDPMDVLNPYFWVAAKPLPKKSCPNQRDAVLLDGRSGAGLRIFASADSRSKNIINHKSRIITVTAFNCCKKK